MNFSIIKAVAALRDNGWQAVKSEIPGQIIAAKQFGVKYPKIIQFILIKEKSGYTIVHPNYEFVNRISHFRAVQREVRLSLNKTYLTTVISSLKRAGIWQYILNQNFLKVNDKNNKSNKKLVKSELDILLS